jgi:hypothetical protein
MDVRQLTANNPSAIIIVGLPISGTTFDLTPDEIKLAELGNLST